MKRWRAVWLGGVGTATVAWCMLAAGAADEAGFQPETLIDNFNSGDLRNACPVAPFFSVG